MSYVVSVGQYPAATIAAGSAKGVGEELQKLGATVLAQCVSHRSASDSGNAAPPPSHTARRERSNRRVRACVVLHSHPQACMLVTDKGLTGAGLTDQVKGYITS